MFKPFANREGAALIGSRAFILVKGFINRK